MEEVRSWQVKHVYNCRWSLETTHNLTLFIFVGYSYLDRDNGLVNNRGSIDSQDSLWIKTNSNLSSDRPYPYEAPHPMANSYMYPDDYHHMHEDMMNQRNRELLGKQFFERLSALCTII